jgi:hypothetical protein
MMRSLNGWLAAVLAIGAVAAPVASATDMRSPDARDAALPVQRSSSPIDLRTPDAADAVHPRQIASSPPVQIVRTLHAGGSSFHWGDAAMGAGVIAVLLMGAAGMLVLRRGPRPRVSTAPR